MIYWWRCPANRGAVVNPCAPVPWHQVQLRIGVASPASRGPPAAKNTTSVAIFEVKLSIIRVLVLSAYERSDLLQIAEIGRDRCDLRLRQIVGGGSHDGRCVLGWRALAPLF